jgi:hypothetical protein
MPRGHGARTPNRFRPFGRDLTRASLYRVANTMPERAAAC